MTGCNQHVEIQNGELPADLVPFTERFVGNYSGEFLKSVSMKRKKKVNKALVHASFELDKGRCDSNFDGEFLHLSFDAEKNRINAEIVESSTCIDTCTTTTWPDGSSSTHCGPECSVYYRFGTFKRN